MTHEISFLVHKTTCGQQIQFFFKPTQTFLIIIHLYMSMQVLRGMPNGEGPKLVEREDGIDAMERFQFHENEDLRNLANALVDRYFGEDYGLDE